MTFALRMRHANRYTGALRIGQFSGFPPFAVDRLTVKQHQSVHGRFVAETRCREFFDSSIVRTDAQLCPQLESSRAWVPYRAGYEFSPSTVLRAAALQSKPSRSLAAYAPPTRLTNRFLAHRNLLRAVSPL